MEERMRNMEEFARYAADMIVMINEDQRRMSETIRRMAGTVRQLAESVQQLAESVQQLAESVQEMDAAARRRDELLQQMLQAVAVIQADIVRIDETHT